MRATIFCLWAAMIAGCSSVDETAMPVQMDIEENQEPVIVLAHDTHYMPSLERDSVHQYSEILATQLFQSLRSLKPQSRVAVGTFGDVDNLALNPVKNSPIYMLGLQLQESMTTLLVQRGIRVVSFKAREQLLIKPDQDLMLSRDVSNLQQVQSIDYYLTGTITPQEQGVVVNARLIDVESKDVVAASTNYIPRNVLWSDEKVRLKNGQIYRTTN